jgi:S-adenosylmethionine synthetase
MLNILLNKISNIIPVLTVIEADSIITVKYLKDNNPSSQQLQQIENIIASWPLDKAKIEKLKQLDQLWTQTVKSGWTTQAGYKLGIDIQDITLLTGAFILAKEANNIGLTDPSYIVDTEGNSHGLSLLEFTQLMLQYGQARATLSNSYAVLKQSINESTTLEELNAINLTI